MKLNLNLSEINLERPQSNRNVSTRLVHKKNIQPDVVEECLDSMDLFKDLIGGIPHQRNRVVRDVCKAIEAAIYGPGQIIYDVGDSASSVYFCLKGSVSICILEQQEQTNKQSFSKNQAPPSQPIMIAKEMYEIKEGEGFGEGEFISETKRKLRSVTKSESTIIGKLELQSFAEVIENYRQRVYYKKRDMFAKCTLLANLNTHQLQFIINNTKLMTLNISHRLFKEGDCVETLYLVNKGQISLWKEVEDCNEDEKIYSSAIRLQLKDCLKKKKKRVFMGLMEEGCFMGDKQLAMSQTFQCNAVAITEKVQICYCDKRIIMSQITKLDLEKAFGYYNNKEIYFQQKLKQYCTATNQLELQKERDLLPPLTSQQMKLKRRINHRHVEAVPSLIGCSSPREIQKMINRKQKRVKTQPNEHSFPVLYTFPSSVKRRATPSPSNIKSLTPTPGPHLPRIHKKQSSPRIRPKTEVANPESCASSDPHKFKSMFIKIKHHPLDIAEIKIVQDKSIAVVGKILGRYEKKSPLHSLTQLIQRMKIRK